MPIKRRVLIIEDDDFVARSLVALLETEKYRAYKLIGNFPYILNNVGRIVDESKAEAIVMGESQGRWPYVIQSVEGVRKGLGYVIRVIVPPKMAELSKPKGVEDLKIVRKNGEDEEWLSFLRDYFESHPRA